MKKKQLSLLLACTMVTGLTACGGSTTATQAPATQAPAAAETTAEAAKTDAAPAAGGKITVLLPQHEMDTVGFYEKKSKEFQDQTGIEVELINMSWDEVANRVIAEMSSGGSSYDVIEFDNSWVARFNDNDWLEPLNGYVTDEIKNGIVPGLLDKFTAEGNLYGIVWNNDTRFLMYNKQKLADAGIEKVPTTWKELTEATTKMKDAGVADYGYVDSYMQAQSGCNEFVQTVYSFGGNFFDKDGNPVMATDAGIKAAYEYLASAYADGVVDPNCISADYETCANTYYSGSTAFFIQAWPGVYASANDPSVSNIVDQTDVAPTAISGDGTTPCVLTLPEAMAIPKTSKNKDAAWKYIEFMSSKDFDKEKCETIGALPVYTDLFADADLLASYPYWEQFGTQSENAKGLPDLLWFDEFSNVVQIESINIITGGESVEDGLASMQSQCEEIMKNYK